MKRDSHDPRALRAQLAWRYHARLWLAVLALVVFLGAYGALTAWFAFTAWRLSFGAPVSGSMWTGLVAGCAAFLAAFMGKAAFFVHHGGGENRIELKEADQPRLFAFLRELADRAGAPRPHKVYVSPAVNAAVFYDLSLLNLVLPARKNLEIGLGLVNALTLGELRAVLAHEFGHFAQRAMTVGRWVYSAQQIAAHLVARRDALDHTLVALSSWDVRIAWIGWAMRLVVWSIRSLVDTVFRGVLLLQRALSRQMEFDADLVAVALTGSDALVHALYKLESADRAWQQALAFAGVEIERGRRPQDLFEVHSEFAARMDELLGQPVEGGVPRPAADADPAAHRVFQSDLAQAPRMWMSHPPSREREDNAKRHYRPQAIDPCPAWDLFDQVQALREAATAAQFGAVVPAMPVNDAVAGEPPPAEPWRQELARSFERRSFQARYRGTYIGRAMTRHAAQVSALYEAAGQALPALDSLYPAELVCAMDRLRGLARECDQLEALRSGLAQAPGGVIRHRGEVLRRSKLANVVARVRAERDEAAEQLWAHDRRCRSAHLAAAAEFGAGWPEHLRSTLAALHYAEHTEANLQDLHGHLGNIIAFEGTARRVGKRGLKRVLVAATALGEALERVGREAREVQLDAALQRRLGIHDWADAVGNIEISVPDKSNIAPWLEVSGRWMAHLTKVFGALRLQALEQLLEAEAQVAEQLQAGPAAPSAPGTTLLPAGYATLLSGAERQRHAQRKLWARFQLADGWLPGLARVAVAGSIVGGMLAIGGSASMARVIVYNGLGQAVLVSLGKHAALRVPAHAASTVDLEAGMHLAVEARTESGALLERFEADVAGTGRHVVYNVLSAAPMVEWTARYEPGTPPPARRLGTPRWLGSDADYLFSDPPQQLSSSRGSKSRTVLSALSDQPPAAQLAMLEDAAAARRLALAHARWDATETNGFAEWLSAARADPDYAAVFEARLAAAPDDVLLRLMQLESASAERRAALCTHARAAAAADPQQPNRQFLALQCVSPGPQQASALADGRARWPENGWFALAQSRQAVQASQWNAALSAADTAFARLPALRDRMAVDVARLQRMAGTAGRHTLEQLTASSPVLRLMRDLEAGSERGPAAAPAYAALAQGRVDEAMRLGAGDARLLRLIAASDRAPAAALGAAAALGPRAGIDNDTLWPALAMALREGRDIDALTALAEGQQDNHFQALLTFARAVKAGVAPEQAEHHLRGLPLEGRGRGYAMACVLLGKQAPAAWRQGARRLLFASERPHFD